MDRLPWFEKKTKKKPQKKNRYLPIPRANPPTSQSSAVPALSKALVENGDPYRHFLPLLKSAQPGDAIPLLTSTVLVSLMAGSRDEASATVDKALPLIFNYLSSLAKNS